MPLATTAQHGCRTVSIAGRSRALGNGGLAPNLAGLATGLLLRERTTASTEVVSTSSQGGGRDRTEGKAV